jgi:hypothetical protein
MPADQVNYQVWTYVDDDGTTWNKRGEQSAAQNAIDGSAALTPGAPVWPARSRRYATREAVFYDPTTFRTKKIIVYTAAAFAAITGTTTLAVAVPGETGTVAYNLSAKNRERKPIAKTTRQLPDHA